VDPTADSTAFVTIALSDFYNPTGDGVYPEGSPYGAGTPLPKGLFIDISSSWCGPCKEEASETLPGKYAELAPKGAEFLLQLADGPSPGTPATEKDLRAWTKAFDVNYPATLDASAQLAALYNGGSFPANAIIRTSTMEIVEVVNGVPGDAFWATLEAVVDEP
jgi:thiol-disulfide isomerase/thioredoxin